MHFVTINGGKPVVLGLATRCTKRTISITNNLSQFNLAFYFYTSETEGDCKGNR